MKHKRLSALLFCLILLIGSLSARASAETDGVRSYESFANAKIGLEDGTIHDGFVAAALPDAQQYYFPSISDQVTALLSGTVDVISCDLLTANSLLYENPDLVCAEGSIASVPSAFAFSKDAEGDALRGEMDEFLGRIETDGRLQALRDKWLGDGAADYDLDLRGLSENTKTVILGTSCSARPNTYFYNGKPTGYELELVALFCREYGYDLDIQICDFSGLLPGLINEKYDIIADSLSVTEERSRSVSFSLPNFESDIVLVYKKTAEQQTAEYSAVAELNREGVNVGIVTGMAMESTYEATVPKAQIKYYNTTADMVYALSVGQIDAFAFDSPTAQYLATHTEGLVCLGEEIPPIYDYAFVFGESEFDEQLKTQYNEYLARIKADGTLDEINALWFSPEGDSIVIDYPAQGENGTVRVATNSGNPPIAYVSNGNISGLEMDILARFCREYGYAMIPEDMDFSALLTGVSSGRYDIAAALIAITDERRESVNFSDSYAQSGMRMVVGTAVEKTGFLKKLGESFERTFIREERWKLIAQGIGVTLFISVCSSILGTLLGFGLCMLRRGKNRAVNAAISVYIRILQGTPLLVLLMILYYIVFARTGLRGEIVAIIAFALNLAAYACEIFRSGIESIDPGQTEAALAIGMKSSAAFFKIVLPQAAMHFLPVYKGEIISLVKMTSIVGYIAVQDLTKMSDIIRSRTYEAFFPLIATAVIYFILSALLTALLGAVEFKFRPKRKGRNLKGVKLS